MEDNQILSAPGSAGTRQHSQTIPPDRILVVEDDPILLRRNTEVLLRAGYEADAAEDGAAAWDALSDDAYDLVITDNKMPKLSGVELLKRLRAARMNLPVIMATGTFPAEEIATSPWLRPDATLLKPYTAQEMLQAVKRVLREAAGAPNARVDDACR